MRPSEAITLPGDMHPSAPAPRSVDGGRVRSEILGFPKGGLRINLRERGSRLLFQGRCDPLLLYFVFVVALLVAIGGGLRVSPEYGLAGFVGLAVMFAPLIVFLSVGSIRLASRCEIDRAGQVVRVWERSYLGEMRNQWPLDRLASVTVVTCPPSRWGSSGQAYELELDFGSERYFVRRTASEARLRREAHHVARFVGVPVRLDRRESERLRASPRHLTLVAAVFSLPVVVASTLVTYVSQEPLHSPGVLVIAVAALVVCQVGAILAYVYDRWQDRRLA
jgi:hypothetical protein